MILTHALASILLGQQGTPSIQTFLQPNLHDATFVARVLHANQAELRKINDSLGTSYSFGTTTISLKEPFMVRVDAAVEDTHILYILNGTTQYYKIPRSHLNTRENVAMKPGKRQTTLDFGVLTPSLFEDLMVAHFVRWDRATSDAVFDITYNPKLGDTSRYRIWIDPQKKYVTKREWYNQPGRQIGTFFYDNPKEVDGIWMPSMLTVKNMDDHIGGQTAYESMKVNTGLPDSLFAG